MSEIDAGWPSGLVLVKAPTSKRMFHVAFLGWRSMSLCHLVRRSVTLVTDTTGMEMCRACASDVGRFADVYRRAPLDHGTPDDLRESVIHAVLGEHEQIRAGSRPGWVECHERIWLSFISTSFYLDSANDDEGARGLLNAVRAHEDAFPDVYEAGAP